MLGGFRRRLGSNADFASDVLKFSAFRICVSIKVKLYCTHTSDVSVRPIISLPLFGLDHPSDHLPEEILSNVPIVTVLALARDAIIA